VGLDTGTLSVQLPLERGSTFNPPKRNKSRRTVNLTGQAIEALKSHRTRQTEERLRLGTLWRNTGLVFTTATVTPMDGDNLAKRSFGPLLTRAGLPRIRFHDFRHTFATILLSRGTHPKIAQEMLGHANISQTMDTYSHVLPDMQGQAVCALDSALF
jgi:integrase